MAIYAVARGNEKNEQVMKRFKQQTQRQVKEERGKRYYKGTKTKIRVRQEAIARENFRAKREKEKLFM